MGILTYLIDYGSWAEEVSAKRHVQSILVKTFLQDLIVHYEAVLSHTTSTSRLKPLPTFMFLLLA